MNLLAINLLTIKPNEDKNSPYVVKDIKGTIVFYARYEHEAEAFVCGVQFANRKQAQRDLWTDYEARFQVLIIGDSFQLYDMAEEISLGEYETEEEAHNEKDDHIKEAEFQNRYENNSGR
jgi:hypothetical protein